MDKNSLLQSADYLRDDQYQNSQNLGARARLHELYSSNPEGWFKWVMAHMALRAGGQVLECGCGPGCLWRENLKDLPEGCQITLTDLSPGMVAEAESALSITEHDFHFSVEDIAALRFDDRSFDLVVANHMLYHVPDREKAFAEVRRMLKPNGRFLAATIGENHMLELRDMRQQFATESASNFPKSNYEFSLENGQSQLAPWFSQIKLYRYESQLNVTDVEPLLAYVLSSSEARNKVTEDKLLSASNRAQHAIEETGSFDITTDAGMFVAQI